MGLRAYRCVPSHYVPLDCVMRDLHSMMNHDGPVYMVFLEPRKDAEG